MLDSVCTLLVLRCTKRAVQYRCMLHYRDGLYPTTDIGTPSPRALSKSTLRLSTVCQKRLGIYVSVLMCGCVVMGLWLVTTTVKEAVTRGPGLSLISSYFAYTSGTFMMAAVILFVYAPAQLLVCSKYRQPSPYHPMLSTVLVLLTPGLSWPPTTRRGLSPSHRAP